MDRFHEILKQYWGYDDFRGIQAEIIESITTGNDTLGLMPTGGGKSITFQVPALALEGMTIVITPLIALMKDQVANLKKRGIQAAAIYSGQTRNEILKHLDNSIFGAYKLLYVSPERLGTEIFQNKVKRMKVSFITVDEAHCISQWGYDFRPSYLQISQIRQLLPEVPVLALTATATPAVVDDICAQLHFREGQKRVFRMSFARRNLYYVVRKTQDKETELFHILRNIKGAAIVYTRSRKGTSEVAEKLRQEGFTALHYHAGLSDIDKDVRQKAWQNDEVRIMVATNALAWASTSPTCAWWFTWTCPTPLRHISRRRDVADATANRLMPFCSTIALTTGKCCGASPRPSPRRNISPTSMTNLPISSSSPLATE